MAEGRGDGAEHVPPSLSPAVVVKTVAPSTTIPPVVAAPPATTASASASIFTEKDFASRDVDVIAALPPPRQYAKGPPVVFTPRAFPTPLRESRAKEEDDWLAKNYVKIKETKDAGKQPGPISFIEKDCAWLRSKAEDFARVGDWDSACNAFSAAIGATAPDAALLLNRAACHLRRFRASMCVDDCSAALELLLPRGTDDDEGWLVRVVALGATRGAKNEKSAGLTLKALSRRFSGLALQGKFCAARGDIVACCALAGEETEAGAHFVACHESINALAANEALKTKGDACVQSGDADGAHTCYVAALTEEPSYAVCYLNRAALYLGAERFSECISDCNRVLSLLDAPHTSSSPEDPLHIVPLPGSELAAACRIRAMARCEEASRKKVEAVAKMKV